jgi:DNA-binding XRE family transcriptional regulator
MNAKGRKRGYCMEEYMPFVQIDVEREIEKRCNESPKFKKEWDDSQEEYRLIGEMIALRKREKITQKELATMTGNKQQVISRIERKDNSPSVKTFSNILKALGYELQIVKKAN